MELTDYIQNDLFECNDVLSMTLSSLVFMRVKNEIDELHPNELWIGKVYFLSSTVRLSLFESRLKDRVHYP